MELQEVDGRLHVLHTLRLSEELLPRGDHVLKAEVHGEHVHGLRRRVRRAVLSRLLLETHLLNHEYRDFVVVLLEFRRVGHCLLDGLLGVLDGELLPGLEALAVGRVHGQEHTGAHEVASVRDETVLDTLCGEALIVAARGPKLDLRIRALEHLEPNLPQREGRDLQVHVLVRRLERLKRGVGHLGAHEEVEHGGVVVRAEDDSRSLGIGHGEPGDVPEPLLDLLLGQGGVRRLLPVRDVRLRLVAFAAEQSAAPPHTEHGL
mmetsp:Transcript_4943/g.14115  ORF Transcript_4943/g.14115 Transcript_4943/m.14115 type:complete len:262 (+) Transcript_4943:661-1446(+)